MKQVLGAFVMTALMCGAASAADLPVKAPPAAVVADLWSGWYVGINGGYGFGHRDADLTASNSDGPLFGSFGGQARASNTLAIPTSARPDARGGVFGGQIGYNWRMMPQWLGGVEADIDWSGIKGSNTASGGFFASPFTSGAQATVSEKMSWFGTVRGRLGYLPSSNFLVYGTGGLAYGHVKSTTSLIEAGCLPFGGGFCVTESGAGSISKTRAGWAAGAGAEWKIDARWSFRTEWLHLDLGKVSYVNSPLVFPAFSTVNTTTTSRFSSDIFRAALNYKL